MPAISVSELNAALGAYNRKQPGAFINKVFVALASLPYCTVVSVKDELPLTNIAIADLSRPNLRDNAWTPTNNAITFPPRILKVRPGKIDLEIVPAALWATWMGYSAAAGAADQMFLPFEDWIVEHIAAKLAEEIQLKVLWKGVYNAAGTTPGSVCHGFEKIILDAITATEIAAGQIHDTGVMSSSNGYDNVIATYRKFNEAMRAQMTQMFMSYTVGDMYNDDYTATFGSAPFNTTFDKKMVHGTNCEFRPTPGMTVGTGEMIVAGRKEDFFVGMDLESDIAQIKFQENRRGIDVMVDYSIGVQIADPRNIVVGYNAP